MAAEFRRQLHDRVLRPQAIREISGVPLGRNKTPETVFSIGPDLHAAAHLYSGFKRRDSAQRADQTKVQMFDVFIRVGQEFVKICFVTEIHFGDKTWRRRLDPFEEGVRAGNCELIEAAARVVEFFPFISAKPDNDKVFARRISSVYPAIALICP